MHRERSADLLAARHIPEHDRPIAARRGQRSPVARELRRDDASRLPLEWPPHRLPRLRREQLRAAVDIARSRADGRRARTPPSGRSSSFQPRDELAARDLADLARSSMPAAASSRPSGLNASDGDASRKLRRGAPAPARRCTSHTCTRPGRPPPGRAAAELAGGHQLAVGRERHGLGVLRMPFSSPTDAACGASSSTSLPLLARDRERAPVRTDVDGRREPAQRLDGALAPQRARAEEVDVCRSPARRPGCDRRG